jgi:hypothetical protein
MNQLAIVCPVCETDQFERLDLAAGSGKCVNRHHVMRRDDGVWYCPDQESPPPGRCRCGAYPPDAAHMCTEPYSEPGFESVRVMRLQPGDALVIEVDYPVDEKTKHLFLRRLEHTFPGHKAIVLDNGARLSITRPDGE